MPGLLMRIMRQIVYEPLKNLDPETLTPWLIGRALVKTSEWGLPRPMSIDLPRTPHIVYMIYPDMVLQASVFGDSAKIRVMGVCWACGKECSSMTCISMADVDKMVRRFLPNLGHWH